METLELIQGLMFVGVALLALVTVIFLLIRSSRLDKVKTHEDLMRVFKSDDKFFAIAGPTLFVIMSVIMLTGAFISWPDFCAMQLLGIILSSFWLLLAVTVVIAMLKKK